MLQRKLYAQLKETILWKDFEVAANCVQKKIYTGTSTATYNIKVQQNYLKNLTKLA